ncbi:uncharacterized protein [Diadema antillarum]|uniref:uncharacterized protein n=1 Tax=Diadema antillarum TaxID=105358 RepID=UPI003A8A8C0C
MAKYDVDRFETPPDEDLVCCICQCVLDNPLESPCRHVFCKVCIETWLTNRNNCPNCRKRLRVSKLKPVLPIVRNMINRLLIKCENREHGCLNGIKLEMYDKHQQNCDYAPIKCLNTGCGETVLRMNMLAHEQNCKFRLIMCKKGCGLPIPMEQSKKHNCLEELKHSMAAMEEQYQQRLRDLENKFNAKIQVLEDRIKAMEENCQQDYNSGWGSARDSYSSMAGFDESDTQSRDMEYTDIQDYEENNDDDDDGSNSFYYSGNEDDHYDSTPVYQESQAPEDGYDSYTPQDHSDERGQDDDRDSDSAFYLNTDADSNNDDSDGDLNDSLLDSSDGQSDGDDNDQDDIDPVQVYEVSPTSPGLRDDVGGSRGSRAVGGGEEVDYDEVIHVGSEASPHSSTQAEHGSIERQHSDGDDASPVTVSAGEQGSSRMEAAGSGRISPHGLEHSSLCSLHVEYGSSGRSSPRETVSAYLSDHDSDAATINEDSGHRGRRNRSSAQRSQERNSDNNRERESSRERRHRRPRSRERGSSRERRRKSRGSRDRRDHSSDHADTNANERSRSYDLRSLRPASQAAPTTVSDSHSSTEGAHHQGSAHSSSLLYGIPVSDSDSSVDPPWERTSQDHSSDVTISEEALSPYDSMDGASSPDIYNKFISSLHNVPSSESDKTWTPGDRDSSDGWELGVDYSEYISSDDTHRDRYYSDLDDRDGDDEHDAEPSIYSRRESSHSSRRSSKRSSSKSSSSREDRKEERASVRSADQSTSGQAPSHPTSDSETVSVSRRRPLIESSSESDNGEDGDHHPAWKRRKHDETQ